jgi:hypothetical protein
MKIDITDNNIKTSDSKSLIVKKVLKPDIVVLSGIKELDELLGGFKAGEITFIDGNSDLISSIPNQLCVNTYRTFSSDTIYIDGGMGANPYEIARYARFMELDQKETLRHVHISRAFTVYQMSTLICDMLEAAIKKHNPRTLIIGRFPLLYLDKDVKTNEAQIILKNNIEKIRKLTANYNLITIFTNPDNKMLSNLRNVRETICSNVDEIVRMNQMEKSIHINLFRREKEATILTFAKNQLRLQDFGMVI